METHKVKSWPSFYSAMIANNKRHDFRDKRDRDYRVGDILHCQEFDPFGGGYTGREAEFRITYITDNVTPCAMSSAVLDRNFAVLSIELIRVISSDSTLSRFAFTEPGMAFAEAGLTSSAVH